MPCSYCDIPGHGIDECPDRLEERFGTAELREGEPTDDDSHASGIVDAQLAEASDDDLEAIGENPADNSTGGSRE